MLSAVKEYTTDFYRLFFPRMCGGCAMPLTKGEEQLCLHCRLELPFTNFESFKDNPVEKIFYGRVNLEFATAMLFFSKGEKVQNILHAIKYQEQKELALFLGRILGDRLQNNPYLKDVTTIIPVPLHPKKQRLRGYNQSALLAEGMNDVLGKELMLHNVYRNVHTETQTNKSRMQRWDNVEKVFDVRKPDALKGKHILLLDDVLTTGATLEACTQSILDKADCKVSIITIAFAQ